MTDSLRPKGTVERTCTLCNWSSWYDPLSTEATVAVFICLPCKVNERTHLSCSSCNRGFVAGHRDLASSPVDSVSGAPWFRCPECIALGVPVGVLAEQRFCQGFAEQELPLSPASWCGKPSIARTSVAGQPDYFVDFCLEHLKENAARRSFEVRDGVVHSLVLESAVQTPEPPGPKYDVATARKAMEDFTDRKAAEAAAKEPTRIQSFTELLQDPNVRKLVMDNAVDQAVRGAAVAQFLAEPYPSRMPWTPPTWRLRLRLAIRAKWDRLRYRVGCMIAGVPLDDDDGGC